MALLNTNAHVYHVSPVFSVMEVECLKFLGTACGFKENEIDGTFNPGGTMSNMMALIAARHERFPHVRNDGWKPEDRPRVFTSHQSHYSISRGAMLGGMGMNSVRKVRCDRMTGQMDTVALEELIQ